MPAVNDEIANATLVVTAAQVVTTTVSNVDSTASAQETAEGYTVHSTWYRFEVDSDGEAYFRASGADYPYYIEIYKPADTTPSDFSDLTDGFTFDSFLDDMDDNGGTGPRETTIPGLLAGDVIYVGIMDYNFVGDEGSLSLEALMPFVCMYDAADGANLASATVSLVPDSPDWVRDEQFRTEVNAADYKGDWDYSESFSVNFDCSAGKYEISLWCRFDTSDTVVIRVLKNGYPYGGYYWTGFTSTPGVEAWNRLSFIDYRTRSFSISQPPAGTIKDAGGPLYFDLVPGDVLTFCYGSPDFTLLDVLEVQLVRFRAVTTSNRPPQWRIGRTGTGDVQETWGQFELNTMDMVKAKDDMVYLCSVFYVGQDATPLDERRLNIMSYRVHADGIEPVSSWTGLDPSGGEMRDLQKMAFPGVTVAHEAFGHNLTIMPNDDIYVCWAHRVSGQDRLVLVHYDASGDTWSVVDDSIRSIDPSGRLITWTSMDNDGENVYIMFGEERLTTTPSGYWWRCFKYDGSFTELGTGQSAYLATTADTRSTSGEFDRGGTIKCSPGGVVWAAFSEYEHDGSSPLTNYEEHAFVWYWDGDEWIDTGLPDPTILPLSNGLEGHSYVLGSGADGGGDSNNYIKFAVYGFYQIDLTFCHHDGPSEYPAVMFQYVFADQFVGTQWDASGFSYWEYDGANWGNEVWIAEGDVLGGGNLHGLDRPAGDHLEQADDDLNGDISRAHGWTQGFTLDNDGSVPVYFTQKGWRFTRIDHVYAAKLLPDGSAFVPLGVGFPDWEEDPSDRGGWVDVTTNAGCMVDGKYVCAWRNAASVNQGVNFAVFLPTGGNISMNWRSSDRRGSANRVLVGTR